MFTMALSVAKAIMAIVVRPVVLRMQGPSAQWGLLELSGLLGFFVGNQFGTFKEGRTRPIASLVNLRIQVSISV